VGTVYIVVDSPVFDLRPCIVKRDELVDVQALIAQSSLERLYVPVLRGFSRMREVVLYASFVSPVFQCSRGELRGLIHGDR